MADGSNHHNFVGVFGEVLMFGIGDEWPLIQMVVLIYSGSDPDTIAAVSSFNNYFSLTFQFGVLAFLFTLVVTLIARS